MIYKVVVYLKLIKLIKLKYFQINVKSKLRHIYKILSHMQRKWIKSVSSKINRVIWRKRFVNKLYIENIYVSLHLGSNFMEIIMIM